MRCLIILLFVALFCGCQNPRTGYMNGLIIWTSSNAVGIGWGEYIEVGEGGKLERVINNGDGIKNTVKIDNTKSASK